MAKEVTTLLFGRRAARIGEVQLDVTLQETPLYTQEISKYPVEGALSHSDNIRRLPIKLELEGLISNSPIEVVFTDITEEIEKNKNNPNLRTNQRVNNPTFVEAGQNALLELCGRRIHTSQSGSPKVFDVVTGLRVYSNMAISDMSFPRDSQTGQALFIKLTLEEIEFSKSETIALPTPKPAFKDKTQSKVPKGKQTPSASTEQEVSSLKFGVNKFKNFING